MIWVKDRATWREPNDVIVVKNLKRMGKTVAMISGTMIMGMIASLLGHALHFLPHRKKSF